MQPLSRKSSRGSLVVAPGAQPVSRKQVTNEPRLRPLAACWLSERTILLDCECQGGLSVMDATLRGENGTSLPVTVSVLPSLHGDLESQHGRRRLLLILDGEGLRRGEGIDVELLTPDESYILPARSIDQLVGDLRTLLRSAFTALDAPDRARVVEFLVTTTGGLLRYDRTNRLRLCRSLNVARDMLRERLPICELRPNRAEGLVVEAVLALDETSFYVEGWMCDIDSTAKRLTAVSPEGSRVEILKRMFRYRRSDTEEFFKSTAGEQIDAKYGFVCFFTTDAPSLLPIGWVFELQTVAGTTAEAVGPQSISDPERVRAELMSDLSLDPDFSNGLCREHLSPALSTLQRERARRVRVADFRELGSRPIHPRVSVIVPLYARIDLLEHQMAQFASDPDLHDSELIYVLDSPELKSALIATADGLFDLYGLPFRIIFLS